MGMKRTRNRSVPMPEAMGPSSEYLAGIAARQEVVDDLPDWVAELLWEYGFDRTMAAWRQGVTPAKTKRLLSMAWEPITRTAR